jgi:hypothetical protein
VKHRALSLDFRRAPGATGRWVGWVLLALAVLTAAATAEEHARVAERHADATERYARLKADLRAHRPRPAPTDADPQTLADIRRANLVIDQLAVPWDRLFDAVEAAGTQGTQLLSLTPTARDHSLRLAGESANIDRVLAYVERLAAQPALGQVHLLGYNKVERNGAAMVSFSVAATWRSAP